MKVLFLKDLTGIGERGQVKEVSNGYAMNFLIPQAIAVAASKPALQKFEEQQKKQERDGARELEALQRLASTLDGYELDIVAKVNDQGTLYGTVGAQKIVQALKKNGYQLKKNQISLPDPIKEPGDYTALIKFGHGLEAQLRVNVIEGE